MLDFIPEKKKKTRNQSEFIPLFSKYSLSDSYLLSHCIILVNKVIKIRTQLLPLGASELRNYTGRQRYKSLCPLPRGAIIESITEEVIFQQERISGF